MVFEAKQARCVGLMGVFKVLLRLIVTYVHLHINIVNGVFKVLLVVAYFHLHINIINVGAYNGRIECMHVSRDSSG